MKFNDGEVVPVKTHTSTHAQKSVTIHFKLSETRDGVVNVCAAAVARRDGHDQAEAPPLGEPRVSVGYDNGGGYTLEEWRKIEEAVDEAFIVFAKNWGD